MKAILIYLMISIGVTVDYQELYELYELERYEEVLLEIDKLDATAAAKTELQILKAFCYYKVKDYKGALEIGENITPKSDSLNLMLAESYISLGDADNAESILNRLEKNRTTQNLREKIVAIRAGEFKMVASDLGDIGVSNGICYMDNGTILYAKGNELILNGSVIYKSKGKYIGSPFVIGNTVYFSSNELLEDEVGEKEIKGLAKDGISKLQIYVGEIGEKITNVKRMEFNNYDFDFIAPFVDSKGNIYFSSNAVGGLGGFDIYRCDLLESGKYDAPLNIGNPINTSFDDLYYREDGNRIYYSSSGNEGIGKLDQFVTLLHDQKYLPMQNLGVKVNSNKSDYSLCIRNGSGHYVTMVERESDHLRAIEELDLRKSIKVKAKNRLTNEFISINRIRSLYDNGFGDTSDYQGENVDGVLYAKDLIFANNLVVEAVGFTKATIVGPASDTTVTMIPNFYGHVTDNITREVMPGVKVYLVEFGDTIDRTVTDVNGDWWLAHENSTDYDIIYEYPDYKKTQWNTGEVPIEIASKYGMSIEAKTGNILKIRNIYFELAKADLLTESKDVLDRIILYMEENAQCRIELSAHTDSRGSSASNMTLSDKRAKSAFEYLIENGIDPTRLVPKGYGESKLSNQCSDGVECTEDEHAQNRRVEMKIL